MPDDNVVALRMPRLPRRPRLVAPAPPRLVPLALPPVQLPSGRRLRAPPGRHRHLHPRRAAHPLRRRALRTPYAPCTARYHRRLDPRIRARGTPPRHRAPRTVLQRLRLRPPRPGHAALSRVRPRTRRAATRPARRLRRASAQTRPPDHRHHPVHHPDRDVLDHPAARALPGHPPPRAASRAPHNRTRATDRSTRSLPRCVEFYGPRSLARHFSIRGRCGCSGSSRSRRR